MYLEKIHADGFRIFDNFKLTLNPGLNIIVGGNNSGKTALIDAIRYTIDTNSSEWIRIQESDFKNGETKFTIQLKFNDITPMQASVYVEHLTHEQLPDNNGRKSVLYVNLHAELTDHLSRGNRFIRTELRSGLNADGPSIERDVRNYLSATYLKPLRDAEAELTASRGSRLSQVLQSSDKFRDQDNVEKLLLALINANKTILKNPGISDSRDRISRQLDNLNFNSNPFNPIIEIIGGTDLSKLSSPERKSLFRRVLEKLHLLIDNSDRHQGLGYNNLLFMATELLLLEQEQDDFPLLLIEEPEAHLHPQLQMKFLKALRDGFGGEDRPALQSILTTHSPNLTSKAPLENIIVMGDGRAFPLRPEDTELAKDDYIFLEKFLDVTKSNLFFAKGVLIVEGDGENILLPTIAKLLGRPLEDYGVSVVNVGSTAYARYAKIFQRQGLNDISNQEKWMPTKVVCLRDLDLWPEKAKKEDCNPIGFKEWKDGNKQYWESYYDGDSGKRNSWITKKEEVASQNVKVEISDFWTFEYSLVRNGLASEVYEAFNSSVEGFTDLSKDIEDRAIQIYGLIDAKSGGKTQTAYALSELLEKKYIVMDEPAISGETVESKTDRIKRNKAARYGKQTEFREKLPQYIVRAIEYVTNVDAPTSEMG